MVNILDEIIEYKKDLVKQRCLTISLKEIKKQIEAKSLNINFYDFQQKIIDKIKKRKCALIAEIKKASPSKGLICKDFVPEKIAEAYKTAHATCISVLTDEKYFQGHDAYIRQVKKVVDLPVLRKDFIIDPYQIYESKLLGADCILLIASILSKSQLFEFEQIAISLGLSVLVEVYNFEDFEKTIGLNTNLLGVNNRNLSNFSVDILNIIKIKNFIEKNYYNESKEKMLICESGISDYSQVQLMIKNNIFGFLIGETIVKAENIGNKITEIFQDTLLSKF